MSLLGKIKKTATKAVKGAGVGGLVAGPGGALWGAAINAASKHDKTKNITDPSKWDLTGDVKSVENVTNKLTGKDAEDAYRKSLARAQEQRNAAAAAGKAYTQSQVNQGRADIQQGSGQAIGAISGGYDQARIDLSAAPNRSAELYNGGLGAGFQADPGYQFRLKQGQDALDHRFSAMGGRGGGDALKAAIEYNQNFASNEFNNYAQRQMGLAGAADQGDWARQSGLAGLASGQGQSAANIYNGTGNALAGLGMQGAGINAGLTGQAMQGIQAGPPPGPSGLQQLTGLGGMALGAYLGGPGGAMLGQKLGSAVGGAAGGNQYNGMDAGSTADVGASDPNALNGVYNTPYAPPGYYK